VARSVDLRNIGIRAQPDAAVNTGIEPDLSDLEVPAPEAGGPAATPGAPPEAGAPPAAPGGL
jgi:hypothetical protein